MPTLRKPKIHQQIKADDAPKLANVANRWDFLLFAHPASLCVMEGEIIPLLREVPLIPGVNGVRKVGDGDNAAWQLGDLKSIHEDRGRTIIPWDVDEDAGHESYLADLGGGFVGTRWQSVYPNSNRIDFDGPGYVASVKDWIARGVCPKVQAHHVASLVRDLERQAEKHTAHNEPAVAKRLEADLKVCRDWLAKNSKPVKPKPRSRPKVAE